MQPRHNKYRQSPTIFSFEPLGNLWEILLQERRGSIVGFSNRLHFVWHVVRLVYVDVTQALPAYDTLNASIYVVQAGFQDYFFPLYDKKATRHSLLDKVQSVVSAITELIDVSPFSVLTLFPTDDTSAFVWH